MTVLRSHLLRLLIALILPFLAPAAALAANGPNSTMSGMADCGEEGGAPLKGGMACDLACSVTGVVVPATPAVAGPVVHPDPVLFHATDLDRGGVSVRPDHPPPR